MLQLSEEQLQILENVKNGKNTVVHSVAGSGKSSIVLSVAQQLEQKKILQLTYNSSLRVEIKEKVLKQALKNITIHTYHSLAVRFYLPNCYTDSGIRQLLYNRSLPIHQIPQYDIIVIDETQDMTLLYYQFVVKFIKDMTKGNTHKIQLLILGDDRQSLYEFKGSDCRFLTMAEQIWENHAFLRTKDFAQCTMKMSYRITNQICAFVNQAMLGYECMDACREGDPVKYIRNSRSNIENTVIFEINRLLSMGVYPSDIFVLGASVKGANSNVRKMENALSGQGIPCHVPMMETDKIDERVIGGKVVFSTFHCVKGRQRDYVFIVGFDNGYLDFYARNLPKNECPNTLYVGATRAKKGLYLLESDNFATDRPLEFLKLTHHEMKAKPFVQFKGVPRSIFYKKEGEQAESINLIEKHYITPTELIKFIPESVIEEISPLLDKIFIRQECTDVLTDDFGNEITNEIEIPTVIRTKNGFYEEVSDLNGIAIPIMYYDGMCSDNSSSSSSSSSSILHDIILQNIENMKRNEHPYLREIVDNLPETPSSISDYLYLANVYVAVQEKLYFKLKQIGRDEYDWLNPEIFSKCKERLHAIIGKECENMNPEIEKTIIHRKEEEEHTRIDEYLSQFFENHKKFRFTARVDLISATTIWELKCTSKLSIDHLLQVVIYAWIWNMSHDEKKEFKIFNIKTGEIMVLDASMEELHYIMLSLLQGKYLEQEPKTDEEFMAETNKVLT